MSPITATRLMAGVVGHHGTAERSSFRRRVDDHHGTADEGQDVPFINDWRLEVDSVPSEESDLPGSPTPPLRMTVHPGEGPDRSPNHRGPFDQGRRAESGSTNRKETTS